MLLYGQAYALEVRSTLKLYHHLFSSMSSKKSVNVYVEDVEYANIFVKSKYINLVSDVDKADFILVTTDKMLMKLNTKHMSNDTIIITNKYSHMTQSDKIVGAFYYRKGRKQFLFVKPRLEEHNVTLPSMYKKYIVDEL